MRYMPPVTDYKQTAKNDIEKAMDRKEQSINRFIDKKEQGMAIMAAGRDACMIVTAKLQHKLMSDEDIEKEIKKWSKWFLAQYTSPF